jgi:hypothetical protein
MYLILLKQQSTDRHVAPLEHILILSQPFFTLIFECYLITNFTVFGLTRPVLELTIYRTRSKHHNHYTTDAFVCILQYKNVMSFYKTIFTFLYLYKEPDDNFLTCSRDYKTEYYTYGGLSYQMKIRIMYLYRKC